MIKKLFSSLILLAFALMPIFGLELKLPSDKAGDDITMTTTIRGNEDTLFKGINLVNDYLWWSFAVVCTALVIYGGYELITAHGDKKALKKAQWIFIGTGVGVVIAMLSYTVVRLLTDLL